MGTQLHPRGTTPNFWPTSVVAKRLDGSRCHLVGRYVSALVTLCYMGTSLPSAFQRRLNAGGIPVKLIAADCCRRWLGLCRYAEFGRYSAYRIPPSILYIPGHCPICPVTDGIHDVLCKCVCKKCICRHLKHQNPAVDRRRQITPYINKTHNTTAQKQIAKTKDGENLLQLCLKFIRTSDILQAMTGYIGVGSLHRSLWNAKDLRLSLLT